MSEPRFPQRLDIKDMPRDAQRSLGGLRQALCASFNYCRRYPDKMATLKAVVKYVYQRIVDFEKQQEEYNDQKVRAAIVAKATQAGIELDERLSTENLKAELTDALAKKSSEKSTTATESTTKAKSTDKTTAAKSTATK